MAATPPPTASPEPPAPRPPRWLPWLWMAGAVLALVVALDRTDLIARTNRVLQDALLRLQPRDVAASDLVIVAIDDKSVAALGRWPWPRQWHARLIDRLGAAGAAAIGLDVLLLEPDTRDPAQDQALAQAIARNGKVVLPMMMQNHGGHAVPVVPQPALARGAAALGHVHLPVDDDGVARGIYLWEGEGAPATGEAAPMWPHFSLALLAVAGRAPAPGWPATPHGIEPQTPDPIGGQPLDWRRAARTPVAFAGPPGSFTRHSVIDVLDGSVPPEALRGKLVLVGATATGIGDLYATPATSAQVLMPGVEISANLADTLLQGRRIRALPPWAHALANALPALLAFAALGLAGPFRGLLVSVGLMAALMGASVLGALGWQVQLGPVAGLLGLAAAYMLWSWRRMDTAVRYLVTEYRRQQDSGVALLAPPRHRARGDVLDRRIDALTGVTQQLRDLHRFVRDSLDGLPDATLVCDRQPRVLLSNTAALRFFGAASAQALHGRPLAGLLAGIVGRDGLDPGIAARLERAAPAPGDIEAQDGQGRDLLLKWSPAFSAAGAHTGWVLSLVDVSHLRAEQRERDDAMRFLSHDMRAPQSAILTLLDLVRQNPEAMDPGQFQERLERHARKALALSDGFINLLRAQSREYRLERQDLGELLADAVDDAWEKAQARRIRLRFEPPPWPADCLVDRELISRALGNLLGNALKFSPEGSEVECTLSAEGGHWAIAIQDQGPGIPLAAQADLFRPLYRVRQRQRTEGTGLGLPFVKTVAVRHGGEIGLRSDSGQGCRFTLRLPRTPAPGGAADNPAP